MAVRPAAGGAARHGLPVARWRFSLAARRLKALARRLWVPHRVSFPSDPFYETLRVTLAVAPTGVRFPRRANPPPTFLSTLHRRPDHANRWPNHAAPRPRIASLLGFGGVRRFFIALRDCFSRSVGRDHGIHGDRNAR